MRLHDVVEAYIRYKRSLGMRFRSQAAVLHAYCRAMGNVAIAEVRPESVLAFIAGNGPVTARWIENYRVLRGFYRYAIGRDLATTAPPPVEIPKLPRQLTPYIYTVDELKPDRDHRYPANTAFALTCLNNAHAASAPLRHGDAHWRGPVAYFAGCRPGESRTDSP
jgi:hypothetical protein